MKTSSETKPPLTRSKAVNCLIVNQLATPGLGSLLAGRLVAGIGQLLVAVAGFCLIVGWFVTLFVNAYRQFHEQAPKPTAAWMGWYGLLFFGAAWVWSLVTSLSILRAAPKTD